MYRLFDSIPISAVNSVLRLCLFPPAASLYCVHCQFTPSSTTSSHSRARKPTWYHKATAGTAPEENMLLPDILHVSFGECIIHRWWSKKALGSYSKGTRYSSCILYSAEAAEITAVYSETHSFFPLFFWWNFDQSKILLCTLCLQKVTVSKGVCLSVII